MILYISLNKIDTSRVKNQETITIRLRYQHLIHGFIFYGKKV